MSRASSDGGGARHGVVSTSAPEGQSAENQLERPAARRTEPGAYSVATLAKRRGAWLAQWISRQNLTPAQLCERHGLELRQLQRWLRGEADLANCRSATRAALLRALRQDPQLSSERLRLALELPLSHADRWSLNDEPRQSVTRRDEREEAQWRRKIDDEIDTDRADRALRAGAPLDLRNHQTGARNTPPLPPGGPRQRAACLRHDALTVGYDPLCALSGLSRPSVVRWVTSGDPQRMPLESSRPLSLALALLSGPGAALRSAALGRPWNQALVWAELDEETSALISPLLRAPSSLLRGGRHVTLASAPPRTQLMCRASLQVSADERLVVERRRGQWTLRRAQMLPGSLEVLGLRQAGEHPGAWLSELALPASTWAPR